MNQSKVNWKTISEIVVLECESANFISDCKSLCEKHGKQNELAINVDEFWTNLVPIKEKLPLIKESIQKGLDDLWFL